MRDGPTLAKFPAHSASGHHASSDERLVECVAAGDRLASDVFLDVWKHACRFEGRSQVSTWLLSIARHKAISALRRRVDEPLDNQIASETPDNGTVLSRSCRSRTRAPFCGSA